MDNFGVDDLSLKATNSWVDDLSFKAKATTTPIAIMTQKIAIIRNNFITLASRAGYHSPPSFSTLILPLNEMFYQLRFRVVSNAG